MIPDEKLQNINKITEEVINNPVIRLNACLNHIKRMVDFLYTHFKDGSIKREECKEIFECEFEKIIFALEILPSDINNLIEYIKTQQKVTLRKQHNAPKKRIRKKSCIGKYCRTP